MKSSRSSQVLPPKQTELGPGIPKTKGSGNAVCPKAVSTDFWSTTPNVYPAFTTMLLKLFSNIFCRKFFLNECLSRTLVHKLDKGELSLAEGKRDQSPTIFLPSIPRKRTLVTQVKNLYSGTQFLMASDKPF